MKKIVLTSCGIIDKSFKEEFYKILDKDISEIKLLYITIAVDGELNQNRRWLKEEYESILDLGIKEENIHEYKYENDLDFCMYDAIYMMGGNTFYLIKELREKHLDEKIINAINNGVIYIGSSAGSIILGTTTETALPFDENWVELDNFEGLGVVDALIIPHANRKQEFVIEQKEKYGDKIIDLYDDYGKIIIN